VPLTVYTVGHGNRSIEYLLQMLRAMGLQQLVDVRAHPSSVRHPQFTNPYLQRALADSGIAYYWQGSQLGGRRKGRSPSPHHAISSPALRAYADYTQTRKFLGALRELIESASAMRTVLMCAERDPSHCHRSLISDFLIFRGIEVIHLIDNGTSRLHEFNPLARCVGDHLIYDRGTTSELGLER
jgi:uncharacterized protein (DUF488 family)